MKSSARIPVSIALIAMLGIAGCGSSEEQSLAAGGPEGSSSCVQPADPALSQEIEGGLGVPLSSVAFAWVEAKALSRSSESLPHDFTRDPKVEYVAAQPSGDTSVLRESTAPTGKLPAEASDIVFSVEASWFEVLEGQVGGAESLVLVLRPPLIGAEERTSWALVGVVGSDSSGAISWYEDCQPGVPVAGIDLGESTDLATAGRLREVLELAPGTSLSGAEQALPAWSERSPNERTVDPELTPQEVMAGVELAQAKAMVDTELLDDGLSICSRSEIGWGYCYALGERISMPVVMDVYVPKTAMSDIQFMLVDGREYDSPVRAEYFVSPAQVRAGVTLEAGVVGGAPTLVTAQPES